MPPKKKNDKKNGISDRPRDQPSLLVAFAKQIKLQKCTICSQEFAAGVFAAHKRDCRVRSDDEECQIMFTQTAEEKWAAGLITLDELEGRENSIRVKKEGEFPTTSRGPQNAQSTQRRRATKRRIEEEESAEDDSDFAMGSQEVATAEDTIRRREEPVRTRRSARVNPPTEETQPAADDPMAAAAADDLDVTMRDEEEDAATAAPPSRRLTRSTAANSQEDNQIFVERSTPSPPPSQSSSMEVETGFIPDEIEEAEEEPVDLNATIHPQEEDDVDTRRSRRRQKDTVEPEQQEALCDTPPPPEERRATRRSIKEVAQSSQSSQEAEGTRKGRRAREEERKKTEEAAKRKEAEETERRNREKRQKEKKKEEEEKRRKEEERRKEAEKTKEQPIAGLTKIVLRALEDKCIRHEKGLIPSQELVQAPVISLEEEDPEVVPHYVYLMCKIMKRVVSTRTSDGRVHDESFWGEELRIVSRFLSLKDDAKLLFIRLFTRKRGWHLPEKLREKYDFLKGRLDEALIELLKDGFLENGKSALSSTEETLRLCSLDKLKLIAKDFRVDVNKPKPALINALLQSATSQRQLFVAGTPGNTGRLLMVSKKHLGSVYRTSPSADSFFRALFSLYSPALSDSILVAEDRTTNIISHMMFLMKEIHYENTIRKAPFPCEEIIGVYQNKEDLYHYRASSTTSDGDGDYEPIPPIILYTDGIRGSEEKGSHMGIGIYVEDVPELSLILPLPRNKDTIIFCDNTPELLAIQLALFHLLNCPSFLMEDVIIRTRFNPVVNEFEKWHNGDYDGSRSLQDVWEQMNKFVEAKVAEERQLRALDRHDGNTAFEEAQRARETLAEMRSARIDYLTTLPAHHLPYTTEAVLTRIVSRGVDCLERQKEHASACNWIKFIINNQVLSSLHRNSIGALYERLALDLHHHCNESDEAIDEIKRAFDDPLVPDKHRLNLDDRAKRILKDEWQSRFSLIPPTEIVIEGETIGRDLGDERRNRFVKTNEQGDVESISVERVALDYFLKNGMEDGLHSEGEIWHLTFKLLFWDVIYSPRVGGVWLCELQVTPLDYDHSLYEKRKEEFEERFTWLRNSSEADRLAMMKQNWHGIDTFSMEEMRAFLTACDLPTLVGVMETLVKEPRNRRSGFPDLVLWSASKRIITVAEVKGPGDTLSTKQRLWLDFFMKQDKQRVKAYLCKVKASGRKRLQ